MLYCTGFFRGSEPIDYTDSEDLVTVQSKKPQNKVKGTLTSYSSDS